MPSNGARPDVVAGDCFIACARPDPAATPADLVVITSTVRSRGTADGRSVGGLRHSQAVNTSRDRHPLPGPRPLGPDPRNIVDHATPVKDRA